MTNPKGKTGTEQKATADAAALGRVPNLEPLFAANDRLLAHMAEISSAMFDFGRARMKHAAEVSGAMTGVSNLGEAMDLHARYTRATFEEGLSTAGKIAALSMGSLVEGMAAAQRAGTDQHPPMAQAAE